ncbi:sensor histidine kinase [Actinoplanes friuliensis]|uniref:Sensor-like histidine kinase SenX3 n=1 Tax=Actinoplanes friuliensis DSM 7358 TaxID=1246995 RepID=U5WAZ9_9ACTN|nr:PAS domain-containing sensor histidine kinase [Actinoplanes friuliensis]AGZ46324.1 putative two-component system sensor kinase [Actinoplanes friuliensis DSM 7358]
MQIAAHDVGRLSRIFAGCAGVAVAVFGALSLLTSPVRAPESALTSSPAAALVAAGLALLLLAPPRGGPAVRGAGYVLAVLAAALGAAALARHPAAGVAALLAGLALAGIDMRLRRPGGQARFRIADPLLAGAAIIALVALVPRMFAPTFPDGGGPDSVMSPYYAGALLTLAVGAILARPEAGPLRTDAAAGPGTKIRRALPVLVAVPVVAALISALAVRTGISRPAAAISTGAVLAALAVLALVGFLVRSLEGADRRQRNLVAELREGREFADTLLQSMNEAVMVLDANYRVIDVNRRWRELTGNTEAPGPGPAEVPPAGTGDWVVRHADGTDIPVLATMAPIPDADGRPRAYVATYVDIADRKRAEDELNERAAELERSNDQLREANTRLEAALTFKNDLTSMLTHDVAQPISSIASLSELLSEDWADLPEDIRLELATKIGKNTHRLIKMMNDLQLLFRLDTGSVTARRTPVSVLEVATTVAAELECTGDVEIVVDEDLAALADRQHVWHVIRNLLGNALKYGEAPLEIRAEQRDETVVLMVQDAGAGIPEELVPNLFDRFMRGSGLGLFIVRHLVEANGGSVRYERAEPRGARLVVTLESASL